MASEELTSLIKTRQKQLKLSITELARRSSLARQSIYRLFDGEVEQTRLTTFISLAGALELHPMDLFRASLKEIEFPQKYPERTKSVVKNDDVGFIGDITYPDNSIINSGEEFTKIWEIRNVGDEVWENRRIACVDDQIEVKCCDNNFHYGLVPISGACCKNHSLDAPEPDLIPFDNYEIKIPSVSPDESLKVFVRFKAPTSACTIISWWKMVDEMGELMFPDITGLYCQVKVVSL